MRDVLALLTAGTGLFFLGLHLVSSGFQDSSSRTLRGLIRQSTGTRWSCALVGVLAGVVMQSTSAVTTVLGSMATSGLIALRQALPIVAFANVGTTALVFATALDLRTAVLFAVGVGGVAFSLTETFRWKAISGIILGVALFLYGGDLMTSAASGVQQAQWFSGFLHSFHGSTAMSFALGLTAAFLAQSTSSAALMTVTLANAGLLDLSEAITMIYGANLGSTLLRMLLTGNGPGTLRQVSRFQDMFKFTATSVFVALFYLEHGLHIPLVSAAVAAITPRVALQLALVNLLFNGSTALCAAIFNTPIARFVVARWPSSVVELLSVPEYINLDAATDPVTALDLLEKEQMRILRRTREYLTVVRPVKSGGERVDPAALHKSFLVLFDEIEHFQVALVGHHLDAETSERLGNVQGRQKLLELVEDSLLQLATSIRAAPPSEKLEPLTGNFIEALDFLMMFAGDAARTLDRDRAQFVFDLSSDRGEMMGGIRSLHLSPEQALTAEERTLLLRLTTIFERTVWMLQRYAELLLKNTER